uniref:2-C-methyl-D-erythritol 4-phosphate cytidylyltransferase n=1 Tax=Magnetococcus massalia (strain MO-1) TaxID=451514 RepID=A0A1S7LJN9_MAGMO|nr:2-C-methyl-D-erythritol 4-phosphate cytidylyltransferase [Candidatus Magnetococcus massalia]
MMHEDTHPLTADNATAPCGLVLVAAGRGSRFGHERPKQYHLLDDEPVILHTIRRFHAHPLISHIVPVIAEDDAYWSTFQAAFDGLPKLLPPVHGGAERQDSVRHGVEALAAHHLPWVAIHDAARPLIRQTLLDRLLAARERAEGILAALPAHDTVKQVDESGFIARTLDRSTLWLAQTPQLFPTQMILDLHQQAKQEGFCGTDDASIFEWAGKRVLPIEGDPHLLKITQPEDIETVRALLKREQG